MWWMNFKVDECHGGHLSRWTSGFVDACRVDERWTTEWRVDECLGTAQRATNLRKTNLNTQINLLFHATSVPLGLNKFNTKNSETFIKPSLGSRDRKRKNFPDFDAQKLPIVF